MIPIPKWEGKLKYIFLQTHKQRELETDLVRTRKLKVEFSQHPSLEFFCTKEHGRNEKIWHNTDYYL